MFQIGFTILYQPMLLKREGVRWNKKPWGAFSCGTLSKDFTMTIFKFILVAALPFVAAPFMTDQSSTTAARSGNVWSSTVASASEMQASKSHGESTIYKNQAIPGFLFKQFVLQGDELIFTPDYNAVVVQNRGYLEV
jgi:hypothetical protein